MKSLTDELQDVRAERDVFQQKAHRLNVEMNHIVGNDEIRILDIDALCMENRFVKNYFMGASFLEILEYLQQCPQLKEQSLEFQQRESSMLLKRCV